MWRGAAAVVGVGVVAVMFGNGLGRVGGVVDARARCVARKPTEGVVTASPAVTTGFELLAAKAAGQQIR